MISPYSQAIFSAMSLSRIVFYFVLKAILIVGGISSAKTGSEKLLQIRTPLGIIQGIQNRETSSFLGIPYAEAPIGPLR